MQAMWQPWQQTNDERLQNSAGQNLRNLAECIGNVIDKYWGRIWFESWPVRVLSCL
jgi:hypothetical protein